MCQMAGIRCRSLAGKDRCEACRVRHTQCDFGKKQSQGPFQLVWGIMIPPLDSTPGGYIYYKRALFDHGFFDLPGRTSQAWLEWGILDPMLQAVWLPDGHDGEYQYMPATDVSLEDVPLGLELEDFDEVDGAGIILEEGNHCHPPVHPRPICITSPVILEPGSEEMADLQRAIVSSRLLAIPPDSGRQTAGAGPSRQLPESGVRSDVREGWSGALMGEVFGES